MKVPNIRNTIAGVGAAIYGNSLNNDPMKQLQSAFEDGKLNPGDIFIYLSIAAAVLGVVLLVVYFVKKKK